MHSAQLICLAAIALILLVAFYRCPHKESFKILHDEDKPTPAVGMPPIVSLQPGNFQGKMDYRDLVVSPPLGQTGESKENFKMEAYLDPKDLLPRQTMDNYAPQDVPNHRFVTVQLKSSFWEPDTDVFMIGRADQVKPIRDFWRYDDVSDYDKYQTILTGTSYGDRFEQNAKMTELRDV